MWGVQRWKVSRLGNAVSVAVMALRWWHGSCCSSGVASSLTSHVTQSHLAYLQTSLCVGELYPGLHCVWMVLQRVKGSGGLSTECGDD